MVDIREIDASVTPPANASWVLIEGVRGKFAAKGALVKDKGATFGPSLFADFCTALEESRAWALEHGVPIIYVKII